MGQDQNYQDKSWLLPALEERLVEFQAAAPRWLLALQGNLPGAVRLSQQSGYPGAVTELVQANKSRKLSNGTWFGGVHHSSPRLATIAVFLLKKTKHHKTKQLESLLLECCWPWQEGSQQAGSHGPQQAPGGCSTHGSPQRVLSTQRAEGLRELGHPTLRWEGKRAKNCSVELPRGGQRRQSPRN